MPEFDVHVQAFNHTFAQVRSISVTGPDGEDVAAVPLIYNPGTEAAGISAPLVDTPVDDERGRFVCKTQVYFIFPPFSLSFQLTLPLFE